MKQTMKKEGEKKFYFQNLVPVDLVFPVIALFCGRLHTQFCYKPFYDQSKAIALISPTIEMRTAKHYLKVSYFKLLHL